jgi:hypothetical protein
MWFHRGRKITGRRPERLYRRYSRERAGALSLAWFKQFFASDPKQAYRYPTRRFSVVGETVAAEGMLINNSLGQPWCFIRDPYV